MRSIAIKAGRIELGFVNRPLTGTGSEALEVDMMLATWPTATHAYLLSTYRYISQVLPTRDIDHVHVTSIGAAWTGLLWKD